MAYEEILDDRLRLTQSYKEIIEVLRDSFALTDNEIARKLGYFDPNKIRPRRNELMKAGLVEEVGRRADRHSGKTSIIWDLTEKGRVLGKN